MYMFLFFDIFSLEKSVQTSERILLNERVMYSTYKKYRTRWGSLLSIVHLCSVNYHRIDTNPASLHGLHLCSANTHRIDTNPTSLQGVAKKGYGSSNVVNSMTFSSAQMQYIASKLSHLVSVLFIVMYSNLHHPFI